MPDYRHPSYVKHKLQDILSICILGFLADCNKWEEIADFAQQKEKWLKKYLELPNGIPSSDTIRLVAGNIDAVYFYQAVVQSLEGLVNDVQAAVKGQELSMDGKESRGPERIQGHNGAVKPLQALNLYSLDCGFCIEQEFIKEKTNEIPAGPVLLGEMDIKGKIVTWDALNTQKETVEAVIRGKGDYVAALKGNHPLFYKELAEYFS
ncbi:MAG: ISAs1 family transposase [Eubacterium sp.]|nr:ISAs1 family transposase [Eubacterium sp.]